MSNYQPLTANFDSNGNLLQIWGPNGKVAYDPYNADIRGGGIGGLSRLGGVDRATTLPHYTIGEARLIDSANIDGQAFSASNYNNFCTLPTVIKDYQGLPGTVGSGAIVEPSMLYFPQGWNGWEFWLAAMPYDGGNAQYENPSIFVSHDGKNWTTPAGASNPLVLPPNAVDHNYDNTLFMLEDGVTMALAYGQTSGSGALAGYYYMTTADGVTWSTPVAMSGTFFAPATHYLYTPCPFYDPVAKQWTMYSVDAPGGVNGSMVSQTAPVIAGPWTAPVAVTSNFPAGETTVFHIDLKRGAGNEVIGLAQTGNNGGGRVYPVRIPPNGTGFGSVMQYGSALRACNFLTSSGLLYRSTAVPMGDRWFCLFGTLGIGPGSYGFVPGSVAFDSAVFFEALYSRNGALMPAAQLTGTLQAIAPYSGGQFWDSFNHATFGSCTASGGSSATAWTTAGTGTLAIVANKLMQTASGNSHAYVNTGSADVDLQVVMTMVGSGCNPTFRVQDTNNFWRVRVFSGSMKLEQVVAGTANGVAACTITTSEANSVLRVVAKGNSIRVWWQNMLVFSVNSSGFNSVTNHGVQFGADTTSSVANVLMAQPR